MGWDFNMALIPYGDWWRRHRRTFHAYFHPNIVHKYRPVQLNTARVLLSRLLESPDRFLDHIRLSFASMIMKVTYGIAVEEHDDSYIRVIEEAFVLANEISRPGAFLVDLIPSMKYIPSWFPGAGWKRKAAYGKYLKNHFVNTPFAKVQENLVAEELIRNANLMD